MGNYIEHEYPELLDHHRCKSPHMMLGSMIKSYYAKKKTLIQKISMLFLLCLVLLKGEKNEENLTDGLKDVDAVLTTRELGKLIKMFGINFRDLKDEDFDQDMFGEYTGAGVIFGAVCAMEVLKNCN
ncbi:MAG: [Fe-Fe] hydrogenase large subunit C-terminal domain-containing protein [Streptococcus sp.]